MTPEIVLPPCRVRAPVAPPRAAPGFSWSGSPDRDGTNQGLKTTQTGAVQDGSGSFLANMSAVKEENADFMLKAASDGPDWTAAARTVTKLQRT